MLTAPAEHIALDNVGGLQSEWPAYGVTPHPAPRGALSFTRELPFLLVIAFGLALLLKTFLLQAFFIPSESMVPTLLVNDRVLVNKLAYRFREPARGEVIVFVAHREEVDESMFGKIRRFFSEAIGFIKPAETDFIKRIIGLPGDTIEVTDQGVTITSPEGKPITLREPYIFSAQEQGPAQEPFVVPKDHVFVMGDNRANSSDSRSSLGPIKRSAIIGKAFVRIWPVKRWGILHVPDYSSTARAAARGLLPVGIAAIPAFATVGHRRRRSRR